MSSKPTIRTPDPLTNMSFAPTRGANWGDNSGLPHCRPGYTLDQVTRNAIGDRVVLNSIVNTPNFGSEHHFVGVREYHGKNIAGIQHTWENDFITVEDGKEYIIRAFVNNNGHKTNVARDVKVAFVIPDESAQVIQVCGIISAANANPNPELAGQEGRYFSCVRFRAISDFHLEYVSNSALLENNGVGAKGLALDDTLVTEAAQGGQMIGYYDYRGTQQDQVVLDGIIPGGYQYCSYITIRVRAVFDTGIYAKSKARKKGDDTWQESLVGLQVGDEVEIQTEYRNIDLQQRPQKNVAMKVTLPKGLEYIPGSTRLFTGKWQNGLTINEDLLVKDGISIGNYDYNINAFVRLTVRIVDDHLVNGVTRFVTCARVSVDGRSQDARVDICVLK